MESKLKLYSFGVVAVNKPLSSKEIEVTPMEDLNMIDGEITDNLNEAVIKGQDASGGKFEAKVQGSATVTAEWLPFSSNRKTPPDVRRGEKVAIWQFADSDKYWWSELEYEAKLRKLETVVWMFSNTQKEDEDATPETTYFIEVSTHNKQIHVHTSKNDGEPFAYDIQLNTKDGNFRIQDDIENIFFMDSAAKRLAMLNAVGSFLDINENNIFMNAVDNIKMTAGNDISMTSKTINGTADKTTYTTPQFTSTAKMTVGDSLGVGTGITTGETGRGGDIQLNGSIRVEGSLTIIGDINSSGSARFSGSVSASNI